MNKIILSILLSILFSKSYALNINDVEKLINEKNFGNIENKIEINDIRFPHKIPISTFLLVNNREDLAIRLLNEGLINLDEKVTYKGIIYSEIEIAEILGFENFPNKAKLMPKRNLSKEEIIKRNRKNIYTNAERIQTSVDLEEKLIEKLKNGELDEILKKDKNERDKHLIHILVKSIIDGNNKVASLILQNIDNVNVFNDEGISPLMATGFSNYLEGGNVEFASTLIYDYNADINLENEYGMSAVHIASSGDAYKTLVLLIDSGARFMSQDKEGNIPLDYAIKSKAVKSTFILKKSIELMKKQSLIKNN